MTRPLAVLGSFLGATFFASGASAQSLQPPPPLTTTTTTTTTTGGTYASSPMAPSSGPVNGTNESADSGLGLEWIWLNADVGIDSTSMNSLNSSNLQLQNTSSTGPAFGLAAGVRLLFFTAGVRVRDLQLPDFSLWEVDGEAAFHIRIDHFDPYFGFRGGYAFVGTLSSGTTESGENDVSVHGFNAGLMFGLDYYINHFVSIGIDANPEFLFLQRPPIPIPASEYAELSASQRSAYQQSGSSVGFGMAGTLHLGVHF